jgi:hypothetical protein
VVVVTLELLRPELLIKVELVELVQALLLDSTVLVVEVELL